jgi:aspartokinase/homoserine dehydrogenase 1
MKIFRYPLSHPFSQLRPGDNIFEIRSARYPNGLIIQGLGAGPTVTAAGVFADILRIITASFY